MNHLGWSFPLGWLVEKKDLSNWPIRLFNSELQLRSIAAFLPPESYHPKKDQSLPNLQPLNQAFCGHIQLLIIA